jgi:hypothetical protein
MKISTPVLAVINILVTMSFASSTCVADTVVAASKLNYPIIDTGLPGVTTIKE